MIFTNQEKDKNRFYININSITSNQGVSSKTKSIGTILMILSGTLLYLDKVFVFLGITSEFTSGYKDFSDFIWVLMQSVAPILMLISFYLKPYWLSIIVPIYCYVLQIIWIFSPNYSDSFLGYFYAGIFSLSLIIAIILSRNIFIYYKQKFISKKVEEILKRDAAKGKKNVKSLEQYTSSIPKKIVTDILKKIEFFENNKEFLDINVSLNSLAKSFNTNSNYLSKVINSFKGKGFSNYLNDLRIDYALDSLKTKPHLQKYTVKAIAEEMGFSSPEMFSKTFYKKNKIYPSQFIKQMEKLNS